MNWHEEVVTRDCLSTLSTLGKSKAIKDFYLAGGTALALRLGHRISIDLDFFSPANLLEEESRNHLKEQLRTYVSFKVDEEKDGTMHLLTNKTHLSLFHFTPPLLTPLDVWQDVHIASVLDIATMKISAIIGRGAKKDFIDLFFITTQLIPLPSLLKKAEKKFTDATDFTAQALRALIYFQDAEQEETPRMLLPISWQKIKKHFEQSVRSLSQSFLR